MAAGLMRRARWLLHAVALGAAVLTAAPLLWMCLASIMPTGEATSTPFRWFPSSPTLDHYRTLFAQLDLGRAAFNSALVATVTTAASVCCNGMAGYALAKLRFRGREQITRTLTVLLLVPAPIAMLPLFLVLKSLGLVNSYWSAVIPGAATVFGTLLVRQYALAIPDDLLDAARMDGASEWRIARSIVWPAASPILASLAIWSFVASWNDFLWPLVVLSDDAKYTLPVALAALAGEHVQDTELMMAGSVVTTIPVLVLFAALQRFYIRGVLAGSVK
jgi:multiple sugar transport system permease protein